MNKLGHKIKKLRVENDITCKELANILGVSKQAVSLWEKSKRYPSLNTLCEISKFFNVSIDYLLNKHYCCMINEIICLLETQNIEFKKQIIENENMINKLKSIK
jgi:transcriptional regulator with XRE-family HTH domain